MFAGVCICVCVQISRSTSVFPEYFSSETLDPERYAIRMNCAWNSQAQGLRNLIMLKKIEKELIIPF